MPIFRSACEARGVVFTFRLTELEAERINEDDKKIEEKVRLAYRKNFSLEDTESHLFGRIS
jgi:hypothetical protein